MATRTDCRNAIINAYGCLERGEDEDAASFMSDAADWLAEDSFDEEPVAEPDDESRLRRWSKLMLSAIPVARWFKRDKSNPSEPHQIAPTGATSTSPVNPKRRVPLKKTIAVVILSSVVGVTSNYFSDFTGPTDLTRGQFDKVAQCDSCDTLHTGKGVCYQCGSSESSEKIAAPLSSKWLGGMFSFHKGWQFKDGSTKLVEGEYVVPELTVTNTRRM